MASLQEAAVQSPSSGRSAPSVKKPLIADDTLREMAPLFTSTWLSDVLPKALGLSRPTLHNSDGDEVVFHEVRFPFAPKATLKEIVNRLATTSSLHRENEAFWNWLDEPASSRYHTGHGTVARKDQVQFEIAAAYRHYHAALMYVILTGEPDPRHRRMFDACAEALDACEAMLRPGNTVGEVFAAHARVLTTAGYAGHFLNACGYTMGATYPPTWMDWPMVYAGEPQVLAPNMVFFLHMILLDSGTGLSMSLGETAIITETGCEPISRAPRHLLVAGG